jgi:hypothetical protein
METIVVRNLVKLILSSEHAGGPICSSTLAASTAAEKLRRTARKANGCTVRGRR